jgi:hypothetical protein
LLGLKSPPSDENILILSFGGLNNLIGSNIFNLLFFFGWPTNMSFPFLLVELNPSLITSVDPVVSITIEKDFFFYLIYFL